MVNLIFVKQIVRMVGCALLFGAVAYGLWWLAIGHPKAEYDAGYEAAKEKLVAEYNAKQKAQAEKVLKLERAAAEQLANAQTEIEKERESAKLETDNLRVELERVRKYANARRESVGGNVCPPARAARASDAEDAARGWQLFAESAAENAELAEIADRQRNDLAEWQAYGKVTERFAIEGE